MNRREFITALAAAGTMPPLFTRGMHAAVSTFQFNCFTKHLQWLDYDETAQVLKAAGYDGADLTVRAGGHVLPERVEEDLPIAVQACAAVGLRVPMIVTDVTRADPGAERTLRVAKKLSVHIYRMGYLSYDEKLGIEGSVAQLRPQLQDLAALNREIGITGAYQNHAGARIGAAIWDLRSLLRGIEASDLGIQYDIKHATAEGGHSWILGLRLVAEHINCLAVKDFLWQKNGRVWRDDPVPLGSGMVDYQAFFRAIKELGLHVPITVHVEYPTAHILSPTDSHALKKEKEIAVYKRDLEVTKELMRRAGFNLKADS
ncbi:sugar phosphate isomerase/epimerase [candidate division KSB1 bacterium]|nr:MAG: sugar phosphate isomerase/epimerase [candidate division KSB1 bacterium]